ncbi:hypothetical protein SAMN04487967_0551 [Natronorubrum sediminis]|uniref:Luciferase-like monooxygenase n=1 Tax=Natronorubrum sediminis TaxID=640943 RepID=A0A1H6FPS9_9EURY|nr:luciferase [Natronorubrum sediminis]SEH11863.1 hypothetical protein SAMN04487967_0551 [Natronorubrum sediminis]
MLTEHTVARAGLDAIALKPTECAVETARALPVDTLAIDYEGREHVPAAETLRALSREGSVYLTTPVRADGFDPLGDDSLWTDVPDAVSRILVAGHPAYLTETERERAVAPRFGRALESDPDAWVGTESVERIAMATGATQYDLLSRTTEQELQALRTAGFGGEIAVYAPTVLTTDDDAILDAVGEYVARRRPVSRELPDGAATDSSASARAREVLLAAATEYALVGSPEAVGERVERLRDSGATTVVGYPAQGLESLRS